MADTPIITATANDYLYNSPEGYDTFIMQITGFEENGQTISVPGLGTKFGLHLEGTVVVSSSAAVPVYGPGTVSLVLDTNNNDGAPSAVFDNAKQTGGVAFSNPTGQADDFTLASGQVMGGVFGPQANGLNGLSLTTTFNPSPGLLGGVLQGLPLDLHEIFENTATSRVTGTTASGGAYNVVNNGDGTLQLELAGALPTPVTPESIGYGGPEFLRHEGPTYGSATSALATDILESLGVALSTVSNPGAGSTIDDHGSAFHYAGLLLHEAVSGRGPDLLCVGDHR